MLNKRLLTSCFGLGWLPIAPGTWGSVPPVVVFAALSYFAVPTWIIASIMFIFVMDFSIICVLFSDEAIKAAGKDPGEVVADEFAGQSLALLIILFFPYGNIWLTSAAAFLLFRFFDITKIWPACWLESLPDGWGILLDDIMAGIYAAITFVLINKLF